MRELHVSNIFELKQEFIVRIANAIIDARRSGSHMMVMVDYSQKGFLYVRSLILTKVKDPGSFTVPLREPSYYADILLKAKGIEAKTEVYYKDYMNKLMESVQ